MRFEDYAINIAPIPEEEGGGYLVTLPDLLGCIADGETIDTAIGEARDAFTAWAMAEREATGRANLRMARKTSDRRAAFLLVPCLFFASCGATKPAISDIRSDPPLSERCIAFEGERCRVMEPKAKHLRQ